MKRFLVLTVLVFALQSCSLLRLGINPVQEYYYHNSTAGYDAPVSPVHMAINIEKQPAWGPAGYDCAAFYYMPELNIYYDVNSSMFYYPSGQSWIAAQYLPYSYQSCNLYRTYKVVLNYSSPWLHNHQHLVQFRNYRNQRMQTTIRASRDPKYRFSRGNERPWIDPNYYHGGRPRRY